MKLGILGTGMIVKDLMLTYNKLGVEKTYVLGTKNSVEETKKMCEEYGLDGYYFDYDELLSTDIDTVYVALPNFLHYSFTKKALEAGKHVICEKPVTTNADQLKDLIAIAKANNKILVEAMSIHYLPAYKSMKEKIDQLGDIKIVSFNYSQYSSRYDVFKQGEVLPAFDYKKAGGALMDINVYNLHGIVGMFGKPQNIEYLANIERNIDTSGMMILDYGTFKAVAIGAKDCKAPVTNTIQGDKGYIRVAMPINGMTSYEVSDNQGNGETFTFEEKEHRLLFEFKEFIRMIDELDYKKANEMLETSLIVSEMMQEARRKANIVFECE